MRRILQNNPLLSSQNVSAQPRHHYNPRRELEWAKELARWPAGMWARSGNRDTMRVRVRDRVRGRNGIASLHHPFGQLIIGSTLLPPTANRQPPTASTSRASLAQVGTSVPLVRRRHGVWLQHACVMVPDPVAGCLPASSSPSPDPPPDPNCLFASLAPSRPRSFASLVPSGPRVLAPSLVALQPSRFCLSFP